MGAAQVIKVGCVANICRLFITPRSMSSYRPIVRTRTHERSTKL
jgi:hypothetical protein